MNKVFLTGDTHAFEDGNQLNSDYFPEGKTLTKDDYVIILGDFGFIWKNNDESEKYWLKWFEKKPWTTLFLDGNHENHDRLSEMEVSEWHGGKVHKINDSVIHLMRGEIYNIAEKSFFIMGGAMSIDKQWRIPGLSWWEKELPSYSEEQYALENLEKHGNKVDYILTHTAPKDICRLITFYKDKIKDPMGDFLEEVANKVEYQEWYFGHFHEKETLGKFHCLYKNVKQII